MTTEVKKTEEQRTPPQAADRATPGGSTPKKEVTVPAPPSSQPPAPTRLKKPTGLKVPTNTKTSIPRVASLAQPTKIEKKFESRIPKTGFGKRQKLTK